MLQNRLAVVIASIVLLVAGSLTALAQGLITQKGLSADAAQAVARGALDKCRADGYRVSVTVIDDGARLKAFVRDDGSGPHTIDFSRKKAYSALTFKRTSGETGKAWAENALSGLQGLKPLKKAGTLCRAYPSFVRMKRHDPQTFLLFPHNVYLVGYGPEFRPDQAFRAA